MNRRTWVALGALAVQAFTVVGTAAHASTTPPDAAASGACADSSDTVTITINAQSILAYAPVFLAVETGALEAAGIAVEFQELSHSDALPTLAQGQIDVMMASLNSGMLNAIASGLPVRWAAPSYEAHPDSLVGYWAPVTPGEEFDLSTLEGSTVGSPTAGSGMGGVIFERIMNEAGLDPSTVTWTRLAGGDALIALENGSVDATWLSSPVWVEAQQNENLTFLGGYEPGLNGSLYLVGPGFIDRPELAARFFRVMHETIEQYLQGDYLAEPETLALLASALNIPEEQLGAQVPEIFDPEMSNEGIEGFLEALQGVLFARGDEINYDEPLVADQVVDASFVEAALACG